MELPESVVPEAYREWEVKVFDWQTQCPTLAHPSNFSLDYKLIRLLPTVGCEADAATRYSVDQRSITTSSSTAFAYHPTTGCYVAAWAASTLELELEHCLIDPRDKESRVRIIQVLRLLCRVLELKTVKVFREQWYGPFRDGDQLGGCAIRDSAFASTPPLDASQITGVWEGPIATATFLNSPPKNVIQEVNESATMVTVRDEAANLVLLPKQLWCCLKDTEISGETCCEAGWLLDKGSAITSNCILSKTGDLKASTLLSNPFVILFTYYC
nr:virus resistant/susceptible lipocalin [Ipomoea batatas]